MLALLLRQIDEFRSLTDSANGGLDDSFRSAGDGNDGAVVIGIERPVEQVHALDVHRANDLADLCGVAAFGEVRNALYDWTGNRLRLVFLQCCLTAHPF